MKITKELLTPNKYSRPQIPLKSVKKIAVHYIGSAGSTAKNNRDYFEGLKDQIPDATGKYRLNKDGTYMLYKGQRLALRWVSSHFIIGLSGEVIQCLPLDEWSYCTNQANGYSISIECCHPDANGKFTAATEQSLAELCAYLCEKYSLDPIKDIIRHYDVTGKQCPLWYVPTKYQTEAIANARWAGFKALVSQKMGGSTASVKQEASFKVKILDDALNVRKSAGVGYPITGVIRNHGVYTIVEVKSVGSSEWGRLKSSLGWINIGAKYVKRV